MKTLIYLAIIIGSLYVAYWVLANIGGVFEKQEKAAEDISESESKLGGGKGEGWGKVAGTFLDPLGIISGSGIL